MVFFAYQIEFIELRLVKTANCQVLPKAIKEIPFTNCLVLWWLTFWQLWRSSRGEI